MSIYKNIKALFDRSGLVGGGGPQPELAGVRYFPSTQLPPDVDRLIEAELVAPWRTDQDGVLWYRTRAEDADLAVVADHGPDDFDDDDFDPDSDLIDDDDDDDFGDDDFDGDYDDEEDDDYD